MYVYVCMCVCMYLYISIYLYMQGIADIHRHTDIWMYGYIDFGYIDIQIYIDILIYRFMDIYM
jgi:hypothetical protein